MIFLHLINDEKFTNFTISLFKESSNDKNLFLVCLARSNPNPIYTTDRSEVTFVTEGSDEFFKFIHEQSFDVMFVHYLDFFKARAVLKLPKEKKVVWMSWGADFYNRKFFNAGLYQPETKKVLKTLKLLKRKELQALLRDIYYFFRLQVPPTIAFKQAVSRMNYCSTVVPNEFDLLKTMSFFKAKFVPFSYASLDGDFDTTELSADLLKGNNILVGNSMAPTANHLDVFHVLQKIDLKDRDIIVPLNYGPKTSYRDYVIRQGKDIFGSRFKPLTNFLDRSEYLDVLKDCSVAILNHHRQQGMGNIILLLWIGCKVFLSNKSPIFSFLKSNAMVVYSIEDELIDEIHFPLSATDVSRNRMVLYSLYGHEEVVRKVREMIAIIKSEWVP